MNIKGGYYMLDLTAVYSDLGNDVEIPGIYDALKRTKGKPVIVTYYDDGAGNTQSFIGTTFDEGTQIDIIGTIIDIQNVTTLATVISVFPESDTANAVLEDKS